MATLAQLSDRARRKVGLGLGSHTVTLTYASIADQDTITVHGVVLTCITGSAAVELAQFKKETDATATGDNLEDLIDAIFDGTTGVSASSSSGVTTITGAKSVTTDNTTGFVISSSTYQDEPPYTSDFDQWILDGELDVADKASDNALQAGETGLMEVFSLAGDGSSVAIAKSGSNVHTVTVSDYSNIAGNSTVTIDGIELLVKAAATTERADFKAETSNDATAQNLDDLIGNIFTSTSGVTVAVASAVVTVTGAKTVTSSDSTRLTVAVTTATNLLRPLEVRAKIGSDTALYHLMRLTSAEMLRVRQGNHSYYKVDSADKAQKYWSMWDDKIQFSAAPVSGDGMAEVIGIKTPQTTKTTESDMPLHLQPLVEDYARIQAYAQMQRNDLAGFFYQKYIADIGAINRTYGI